jgi:PAS domain S-box-containing protein
MILSDINEGENSFLWLAENLPGIVYRILIEDNNRMVFFNNMVQTMTGYSLEDLKRGEVCSIDPLILPEDKLNVVNIVKNAIENNVPFEVEYRIHNKSGELKWFHERGRPIRGDIGNPSYIDGVIFDITERMLAEQKLKSEKDKAQKYLDIAGVIIVALNADQTVQLINQKGCEILGEEESEIIGMNWFDNYIPENVREQVKKDFNRILSGEIELLEYYENEVINKNGKKQIISWHNRTLKNKAGQIIGTLSSGLDITARKQSEERFRKQNVFLNNILESLTHPFYVINADDYTVALANFTASSEGLELGQHCYSLTHNRDTPCVAPCKCPLEEVKRTKNSCLVEHVHYDSKGNEKIYEIYGYPILDESGNVVQMIEYALNISDRKIAQQELKESEKNYRDLFENSPISLWEQDYSEIKNYIDKLKNSGIDDLRTYFDQNPEEVKKCVSMVKIININQETIRLFKANKKEDFFAGLDIVFAEESFDIFKDILITFAGGKKRFESEAVNYALNGDKLSIFIVCEIVAGFKEDWSKILISIVDISERKKAELIIQNEITKLRELDQLKNEFIIRTSHELKTPLVSICGSVEFLLNYIQEDFSMKSRAHLEIIDSGGKRLRQLADNLLDILRIESRKYEINVETINLGNIIKRCISGFKNLAEEREITISSSFLHEFYVKVDEVKIEQVIVNLLSNALNYTPYYGQISISSEEAQGYINIKIRDTGVGFTEEEKTRIFEKFGKIERYGKGMDIITEGSGLGLYLSKEIVELHGGKIWLESEGRNKGSTFIVSLPIEEK